MGRDHPKLPRQKAALAAEPGRLGTPEFPGCIPKIAGPGAFRRRQGAPSCTTVFPRYHSELGELLKKTSEMDGIGYPSPPRVPFVNMNLGDCFTVLIVHAERHLGQIEKIRSRPFPGLTRTVFPGKLGGYSSKRTVR